MIQTPQALIARKIPSTVGGHYFSLRTLYATSALPGDRTSEFGQLRYEESKGGWLSWATDEDFRRPLRCAIERAGRHADLKDLLRHVRAVFFEFYHEDEVAYDKWAASLGDATGPGQDWDANHRI